MSPAEHDEHIRIVIRLTKEGFYPRERQLSLLLSYESLLWAGAEGINSQALLTIRTNDDSWLTRECKGHRETSLNLEAKAS
jgi:hypothetical protein